MTKPGASWSWDDVPGGRPKKAAAQPDGILVRLTGEARAWLAAAALEAGRTEADLAASLIASIAEDDIAAGGRGQ